MAPSDSPGTLPPPIPPKAPTPTIPHLPNVPNVRTMANPPKMMNVRDMPTSRNQAERDMHAIHAAYGTKPNMLNMLTVLYM